MADRDGWIRCSERLPDCQGVYDVTYVFRGQLRGVTRSGFHRVAQAWEHEGPQHHVIAWRPLPEPYSGPIEAPVPPLPETRAIPEEEG